MKIIQIELQYSLQNFNYIIVIENKIAWCIDPLDTKKIIKELEKRELKLVGIINTHSHFDHIAGNEELLQKYNCKLYTPKNSNIVNSTKEVEDGEELILDSFTKIQVISTPGHMNVHISLILIEDGIPKSMFTGDSIFVAGIGNCRNGSVESAYETITKTYSELNDDLVIYCGHNYAQNNLKFSRYVEPNNNFRDEILNKIENGDELLTTLGDERKINPFFRLDNEQIKNRVEELVGREIENDRELFFELRKLRDSW